ncbi:hypothetical protein IAT38_000266 [Cryptococcus sp. DSM 104549]
MTALRLRTAQLTHLRPTRLVAPRVLARGYASKHDNDPDVLAREKARNLKGTQDSSAPHKEHAPGWNEHLASDAEANIKADQAGPEGKPGKELQDATIGHTHKHHHSEHGRAGAEHHHDRPGPNPTDSEADVKADRGESY